MAMPILYEDVQMELAAQHLEQELQVMLALIRTRKKFERLEARRRHENHWRTRISHLLYRIAARLELPEPEEAT